MNTNRLMPFIHRRLSQINKNPRAFKPLPFNPSTQISTLTSPKTDNQLKNKSLRHIQKRTKTVQTPESKTFYEVFKLALIGDCMRACESLGITSKHLYPNFHLENASDLQNDPNKLSKYINNNLNPENQSHFRQLLLMLMKKNPLEATKLLLRGKVTDASLKTELLLELANNHFSDEVISFLKNSANYVPGKEELLKEIFPLLTEKDPIKAISLLENNNIHDKNFVQEAIIQLIRQKPSEAITLLENNKIDNESTLKEIVQILIKKAPDKGISFLENNKINDERFVKEFVSQLIPKNPTKAITLLKNNKITDKNFLKEAILQLMQKKSSDAITLLENITDPESRMDLTAELIEDPRWNQLFTNNNVIINISPELSKEITLSLVKNFSYEKTVAYLNTITTNEQPFLKEIALIFAEITEPFFLLKSLESNVLTNENLAKEVTSILKEKIKGLAPPISTNPTLEARIAEAKAFCKARQSGEIDVKTTHVPFLSNIVMENFSDLFPDTKINKYDQETQLDIKQFQKEMKDRITNKQVTYEWYVLFHVRLSALATPNFYRKKHFSELFLKDDYNCWREHKDFSQSKIVTIFINGTINNNNHFIFPTSTGVASIHDLNQTFGTELIPIGLITDPTFADDRVMWPVGFAFHDFAHFIPSYLHSPFKDQFLQMRSHLESFSSIDQKKKAALIQLLDVVFFHYWHEQLDGFNSLQEMKLLSKEHYNEVPTNRILSKGYYADLLPPPQDLGLQNPLQTWDFGVYALNSILHKKLPLTTESIQRLLSINADSLRILPIQTEAPYHGLDLKLANEIADAINTQDVQKCQSLVSKIEAPPSFKSEDSVLTNYNMKPENKAEVLAALNFIIKNKS